MRAAVILSVCIYSITLYQAECSEEKLDERARSNAKSTESFRPSFVGSARFWGKRAIPSELRRASARWGKRSPPNEPVLSRQLLKASIRWGKRGDSESGMSGKLRKASRLWGKRSMAMEDFLPAAGVLMPVPIDDFPSLVVPEVSPEIVFEKPEEVLERVAKADNLRPKLAISSRLWGR